MPRPLYYRGNSPCTHCMGDCVGPRVGFDDTEKWKFVALTVFEPNVFWCWARSGMLQRTGYEVTVEERGAQRTTERNPLYQRGNGRSKLRWKYNKSRSQKVGFEAGTWMCDKYLTILSSGKIRVPNLRPGVFLPDNSLISISYLLAKKKILI
jgi:hypothetical protein